MSKTEKSWFFANQMNLPILGDRLSGSSAALRSWIAARRFFYGSLKAKNLSYFTCMARQIGEKPQILFKNFAKMEVGS